MNSLRHIIGIGLTAVVSMSLATGGDSLVRADAPQFDWNAQGAFETFPVSLVNTQADWVHSGGGGATSSVELDREKSRRLDKTEPPASVPPSTEEQQDSDAPTEAVSDEEPKSENRPAEQPRLSNPTDDLREFDDLFRRTSQRELLEEEVDPVDEEVESDQNRDRQQWQSDQSPERQAEQGDAAEIRETAVSEEGGEQTEDERQVDDAETEPAPAQNQGAPPRLAIIEGQARSERSRPIRLTIDGSVVFDIEGKIDMAQIANPQVADLIVPAPGRVIVVGKSAGSTQLMLKISSEYQVYHVVVEPDYSELENLIEVVSPASDVHVSSLRGRIVLTGYVTDGETSQRIEQLAIVHQGGEVVNHLSIAGVQQTLLRVTVAEVNKTSLRALGINWAIGGANLSRDFFLANNVSQLNPSNFASNGLPDVTTGQLTYSLAPVGIGPNTNVSFGFPRAELQFFLNALRENGLARTLAEPNLVAISGQTASFLAGGEVPIPVTQGGSTAGAITIQYKEFGVRLAFTPTVVGHQAIRLHVMTEVSEPVPQTGPGAGGLPLFAFNTRRVESTIECGNDQSFAIAGLLNEKISSIASKIPGVGDLPILGTLFSSTSYQKEQSELVVIVSPQMVEPLEPNQVPPPPGSQMRDPSDLELFMLQQLEGAPIAGTHSLAAGPEAMAIRRPGPETSSHASPRLVGEWGLEESE